jgi:hypothetical protein
MQSARPAPHDTTHAPAAHAVPDGQARPQAPQWLLSVCVSRHAPLQSVCPAAQLTVHAPAAHT